MAPTKTTSKKSLRKTKDGRTLVSTAMRRKANGQIMRRPLPFRRNKLFARGQCLRQRDCFSYQERTREEGRKLHQEDERNPLAETCSRDS